MIPDIVEIKRLCASSQWLARIENGKILLHDTVAGETVCIGQTDAEPVRRGRWIGWHGDYMTRKGAYKHFHYYECSECSRCTAVKSDFCPRCGAKMDGGAEDAAD